MSHASSRDRAGSPRKYKEEPAPVAAQLVSASLLLNLHHSRTLPPTVGFAHCMHQPSAAHPRCNDAASRAIPQPPAPVLHWLHASPPPLSAGPPTATASPTSARGRRPAASS
ncbi:uncharacterized protein BDZ99DRAFT_170322 [Mytilinidion resinicola]|uniref:Uncharacterized protein n=1 Tax=Mytilinidion resinicola TaxID=574789 RepID=A0A6A6Y439_9PEZI|nr:uncharacterized protein BDZ99DRAFT_170322 [Mytilinidion resinicola]KAF2803288.1 hypothetical protein BDZ99DRAFT_170322 [Mytilinidion resinicola]